MPRFFAAITACLVHPLSNSCPIKASSSALSKPSLSFLDTRLFLWTGGVALVVAAVGNGRFEADADVDTEAEAEAARLVVVLVLLIGLKKLAMLPLSLGAGDSAN